MKRVAQVLVVLLIAGLGSQSWASFIEEPEAVTIDFDDLELEATFEEFAADHYRPLGLVFDGLIPIANLPLDEPAFYDEVFVGTDGTDPNILSLSMARGGDLDIEGSFVVPGTSTPAVTDFVQILVFDSNVDTSLGTLEAFDAGGELLESVEMTTSSSQHATYTISTPGIARFRLLQDLDGGGYDNLVFNAPVQVPEPSTAVLVGWALLGLAACRRGSS